MSVQLAVTGMQALSEAATRLGNAALSADSLVEFTKAARVEPIVLIDADLLHTDMLGETLQATASIFTGYYLQAFQLLNVKGVGLSHLDRLNPNRDFALDQASNYSWQMNKVPNPFAMEAYKETEEVRAIGMESYHDFTHRLPVPNDPRNLEPAMEAALPSLRLVAGEAAQKVRDAAGDREESSGASATVDNPNKHITEATNLAVGKQVTVEVEKDGKTVKIPVSIRLATNTIPTSDLIHILTAGTKTLLSYKERFHDYKSGKISFWKDLILMQDIVDEHKKNLLNDKTQFYDAILRRRTGNAIASALSNNYSVATASNIVLLSSASATELELQLGGPLTRASIRDKVFKDNYLMLLIVVNPESDYAVFYHRGINEPTRASLRDMKSSNKSGNTDIASILAAYRQGAAPGL